MYAHELVLNDNTEEEKDKEWTYSSYVSYGVQKNYKSYL